MSTKSKNAEIELLRFVSMLMILTLHYFNQGNVLRLTTKDMPSFGVVWAVEGICYISVDNYMFISGYFLSDRDFSWRRLLSFYATVFFYSITITGVLLITRKITMDFKTALSVFPIVGSRSNWFVSVYFAVLLVSPLLNLIINSIDESLYIRMLLVLFGLFSVMPTVFFWSDQFNLNDGYSILWFCFLYLVAAYIKRYGINVSTKKLVLLLFGIFILPISKIVIDLWFPVTPIGVADNMFYAYNSVPVFLASLALFIIVCEGGKRDRVASKWYISIIMFLGKVSFGVFLYIVLY